MQNLHGNPPACIMNPVGHKTMIGNIIRIITLILLTHFYGDEVAQGFLHETAGLFLFAVALVLVFLLDMLLWRILPKSWKQS